MLLKSSSGFIFVYVAVFRMSVSISKPNFVNIILSQFTVEKQTSAILEFYYRFRFQLYHRNRHVISHQTAEFHPNRFIYCDISVFKMAAAAAQYYFRFRICWRHCLLQTNFVDISRFTAEVSLLPVWKNKRPPYWKCTSGFDLDHVAVIWMLVLPNFVQIGPSTAEIWRHIDCQDGGR